EPSPGIPAALSETPGSGGGEGCRRCLRGDRPPGRGQGRNYPAAGKGRPGAAAYVAGPGRGSPEVEGAAPGTGSGDHGPVDGPGIQPRLLLHRLHGTGPLLPEASFGHPPHLLPDPGGGGRQDLRRVEFSFILVPKLPLGNLFFIPGLRLARIIDRKLSSYYKMLPKQSLGQNFHSQAGAWEREKIPANSPPNPMKKIGKSRPVGSADPDFYYGGIG